MNVLITGAGGGIGYELALNLSLKHYVYLTVYKEEELKRLTKLLKNNKNIEIFKFDIRNKTDRNAIDILDIDIFISNAAISIGGSIVDMPLYDIRKNFEVNVFDNFLIIKKILKKMIEKDKGKIIIISSIIGKIPLSFLGAYAASKSSISTLAYCLKKEIKFISDNIKIVLIEPGAYHTGFNQLMCDSVLDNLGKSKYFKGIKSIIYEEKRKLFKIIEIKKLNSIIKKISKIIDNESPYFRYRMPFLSSIITKVYLIFKG